MQKYLSKPNIAFLNFNKRPHLLAFKSWSSWITKRFLATYDLSIKVLTGVKSHWPSALQGPVSSCARLHKFINALEALAQPPHTRCYRGEDMERWSSGKSLTFKRQVTPRRKRQTARETERVPEHMRDRDRYSNTAAGEICAAEDDRKHKPKPQPTVLTGTEHYSCRRA